MREIRILVPPPALLKNGELDADGMARYYNWMADHGINGLFLNGSTGEFTILTDEQKVETVRIAREAVGERMFLIAGAVRKGKERNGAAVSGHHAAEDLCLLLGEMLHESHAEHEVGGLERCGVQR